MLFQRWQSLYLEIIFPFVWDSDFLWTYISDSVQMIQWYARKENGKRKKNGLPDS